jgi:hypothetical protein
MYLIDFLQKNYIIVLLFLFSILKIVPPELAGFRKYNNDDPKQGRASRITPLNFILHNTLDSAVRCWIPLLSLFGLKNMVSLIIFLVVTFDIFVRKEISTQAVTLVGIGIVALYLDMLVETGKKMSFFGIVTWERKD